MKEDTTENTTEDIITVRLIERKPTIVLTEIKGLDDNKFDVKYIMKYMRYHLGCSGIMYKDLVTGKESIKLHGDQIDYVKSFLISADIANKNQINIINNRILV